MSATSPSIGNIACITFDGADAHRFAQAQFSGDVDALTPDHWQWNAWLTPQGRVRALMHLVDSGDDTLLGVLRGGDAKVICAEMTRYILRMRVTLSLRTCSACATEPAPMGTAHIDPDGALVLGYGARSLRLATVSAPTLDDAAKTAWRLEGIRLGWPTLPPGEPQFLPQALGLEHLGAVAFDKGCYPGQEIAARLHYRGGHKYRLYHLHGVAPLSRGLVMGEAEGTRAWVLDAVAGKDGVDALVVINSDTASSINVLGGTYSIISRFNE